MHVAIIMDGNGRWAERRGLARSAGHRAGARAVRRIVEAAARTSLDVLTLYAFSADNWTRPAQEVTSLMRLLKRYLVSETARCLDNGVRLSVIGRRDRLSADLVRTIENTEQLTSRGRAAALVRGQECSQDEFERCLADAVNSDVHAPVDLLIRTGGERRLSDFLLWESAYAELLFVDQYWPDFDEAAFDSALREFANRDRRFGGLSRLPQPSLSHVP
jgi:undecaprenyl diphosphate synthase